MVICVPARRNPRTGVEDRWTKRDPDTGKKVPSANYGKGKRWRARWVEANGRERAKGFARKVDAEKHLDNVTTSVVTDQYVAPEGGKVLVGEVLDKYLAGIDVKRKTRTSYMSVAKSQVRPRWEKVPLGQVMVSDIRAWLVDIQTGNPDAETKTKRTGVSSSHARYAGRLFSMALDVAVDDRLIARNPFERVRLPRASEPRQGMSLTEGQLLALAGKMPTVRDRVLTLVMGYTGLRWGEAIALTPRAVDWDRRRVNVWRAYAEGPEGVYEDSPKNHERRFVPFPPFLTKHLQVMVKGKGQDEDIFTNGAGNPLSGGNWLPRVLRKALAGAGVPDAEDRIIHDLRHTFASLSVQAGANIKMLSKALGHADPGFTLRQYVDLFEDDYTGLGDLLEPAADALRTVGSPGVVNVAQEAL